MREQDDRYRGAAAQYGPALDRLARAYEADPEERRDLLQEIHLALWRSFAIFDQRCSLRTWVYRVAHNTAASHAIRRRAKLALVTLEEIDGAVEESGADDRVNLDRLMMLIRRLNPPDRQMILLYLEGLDALSIAEITGFSPGNVATKIHRIKKLLARMFHQGAPDAD